MYLAELHFVRLPSASPNLTVSFFRPFTGEPPRSLLQMRLSSRPVCVFDVATNMGSDKCNTYSHRFAKFQFVDLAGSERVKTSNAKGDHEMKPAGAVGEGAARRGVGCFTSTSLVSREFCGVVECQGGCSVVWV